MIYLLPYLSIQSQRGKIGAESQSGRFDIQSRQPTINVNSKPSEFRANNGPGELRIDQRRAWDALTGGKSVDFWNRIYSQYKDVARQNLSKIVEEGNRMGDLRIRGNPIPYAALDKFIEGAPDLQVYGAASPTNVDLEYIPNELNMEFIPGERQIDVEVHKTEINFNRGSVNIYMEQYPSLTFEVKNLDVRV